jgi:hypothetical protein
VPLSPHTPRPAVQQNRRAGPPLCTLCWVGVGGCVRGVMCRMAQLSRRRSHTHMALAPALPLPCTAEPRGPLSSSQRSTQAPPHCQTTMQTPIANTHRHTDIHLALNAVLPRHCAAAPHLGAAAWGCTQQDPAARAVHHSTCQLPHRTVPWRAQAIPSGAPLLACCCCTLPCACCVMHMPSQATSTASACSMCRGCHRLPSTSPHHTPHTQHINNAATSQIGVQGLCSRPKPTQAANGGPVAAPLQTCLHSSVHLLHSSS